jgi:hypothetical protein
VIFIVVVKGVVVIGIIGVVFPMTMSSPPSPDGTIKVLRLNLLRDVVVDVVAVVVVVDKKDEEDHTA